MWWIVGMCSRLVRRKASPAGVSEKEGDASQTIVPATSPTAPISGGSSLSAARFA